MPARPRSSRIACGEVPASVSRSPALPDRLPPRPGRRRGRAPGGRRLRRRAAFGEGGRVYQQAVARLLVAEGRCEEALACSAIAGDPEGIAIANPAWNPWRAITAAALHGLGRTSEALEAGGGGSGSAPPLGRTELPRQGRCACWASCVVSAELDELREAVRLLASTPAAVDSPAPSARSAAGRRWPDEEAIELLLEARAGRRSSAAPVPGARASLARGSSGAVARSSPRHRGGAAAVVRGPTADPRPDRRRPGRARGRPAAVRHTGHRPGRAGRGRHRGGQPAAQVFLKSDRRP